MINDLRLHVRQSVDIVNRDLPQILEKSRYSSETLATLSSDLNQLRGLMVGDSVSREKNMIAYESEILKLIENSNGQIGVKKTLGTGLADPIPAREWVTRERKGALWDQTRSRSKAELLNRIGRSAILNRVWYIDTGDKKLIPLIDWVKANHPESQDLETKPETSEPSK